MRLVQADCEVTYDGRGHTTLPRGLRLIIVKGDGSVAIHQDKGIRPLNYMSRSTEMQEYVDDDGIDHFVASSNRERIDVKVYGVAFETFLDFPDEAELERQGTEKQLQAWLANEDNFHGVVGAGTDFLAREYQTGKGPVDLLGTSRADGQVALVEVKRYAKRNDAFQLVRYRTALREMGRAAGDAGEREFVTTAVRGALALPVSSVENPHMVLVAPRFHRGVAEECARRGVEAHEIGYGWMETADFALGQHKDEIVGMAEADAAPGFEEVDAPAGEGPGDAPAQGTLFD